MKKSPLPHQQKALRDIVPSAKKMPCVTTVMPCGTGKTMVQLWTAEALKPKTVLVLLPSLSLLRQTLHEWMAQTKWRKPQVLCVCSDQTVAQKSQDEIQISPEDVGYPVTSDSAEIADFLSKKAPGIKLVFSTYHSSPLVAVGMGKKFSFDLAVFDEAHVTAGDEDGLFSFALTDKNLRIKTRTFWTATPRHYDLAKSEEGMSVVYSMDDKSVYGPVVHQLTFRKAVEQNIICDYEVLVSVVSNKMLGIEEIDTGEAVVRGEKVPAKIVAHHVALQQAIQRYGVKKVFTFHPRVIDAYEFANGGPQSAVHHLPKDFGIFHVSGKMSTVAREAEVSKFRSAKRALMSNARCLTQGIDVPAVDLVAFFSKKRSLIDIVQATGRAMRRAPGKTKGYILIPLYVDQERGETMDEAVHRSDFREVWAVLNAMREQDEALADNIQRIRSLGGGGGGRDIIDKVTVMGPQVGIEDLRTSITTICVDRLTRTREIYTTWQEASKAAIKLGFVSRTEYFAGYKQDPRLTSSPAIAYKDFPGWPKFLGSVAKHFYATWQEASKAAIELGFSNGREYITGYKQDSRLPSNPDKTYKDFPGWPKFLDTAPYATWQEASKAAIELGFSTMREYYAGYKQDLRLPSDPSHKYKGFPGWPKFLGKV